SLWEDKSKGWAPGGVNNTSPSEQLAFLNDAFGIVSQVAIRLNQFLALLDCEISTLPQSTSQSAGHEGIECKAALDHNTFVLDSIEALDERRHRSALGHSHFWSFYAAVPLRFSCLVLFTIDQME